MNWFTSDLHLNHDNIRGYCNRPFSSTEEMNEGIIGRWNERVSTGDTVYVVGDVFLGKPENASSLVKRLKGNKILILGNHDRSRKTMIETGFEEVWQRKNLTLSDGRRALLNHKPLPDSVITHFDVQIHGHRHAGPIISGKKVNVCVDLWDYRPIPESEIVNLTLGEPRPDHVSVEISETLVKVTASVRKDDYEGLIDHLQSYTRRIWDNNNDI